MSAPPELIPVPLSVSTLVPVIVVPFKSSTAPLVSDTVLALPPSAVAFPTFNVPALIVVPPV